MTKTEQELKGKIVKGRIKILRVTMYRDHMVYIRSVDGDLFEYILIHNNEVYSSYIVIKPTKGKHKLTKGQVEQCRDLILTGAMATIDTLLGDTDLSDKDKKLVAIFEEHRDKIQGVVKNG